MRRVMVRMTKEEGLKGTISLPPPWRLRLINIYNCLILICTAINIVVHNDIWVPINIKLPICKHNL